MIKKIRSINNALPGLLVGIILFGAASQLVGVFLVTDKANYSIGLWIGVLTAIFMAFHMALYLNSVVERDVKGAQATATRQNIIRYLIVVLILGILMITRIGNPIAAFVGVMGLKVSAYLQPLFEKLSHKRKLNKEIEYGGEFMGTGILLTSADEIDFMVHGIFQYKFFGQTVWITTTHACLFIVFMMIIIFCLLANRAVKHATEVPGAFQNVVELIVEMLDNMTKGVMGKNAAAFANYIGILFMFILLSNISGLFGLRPPTADYGVTLALGLITFTLITFNKFKYQKVSGVIKSLCEPWPIWAPINIIGDIAVTISLSLRLFANVWSGTVMMALIYGLLGWIATAWPAALHVYFDLFSGAIQTYVFSMLTMTYINNAIEG